MSIYHIDVAAFATHRYGHTLDLVITRNDYNLVSNFNVTDPIQYLITWLYTVKQLLRNRLIHARKSHIET